MFIGIPAKKSYVFSVFSITHQNTTFSKVLSGPRHGWVNRMNTSQPKKSFHASTRPENHFIFWKSYSLKFPSSRIQYLLVIFISFYHNAYSIYFSIKRVTLSNTLLKSRHSIRVLWVFFFFFFSKNSSLYHKQSENK